MANIGYAERPLKAPVAPAEEKASVSIRMEVIAVLVGLVSIFLLISLIIGPDTEVVSGAEATSSSLVGPVGSGIAWFLSFLFGQWVSFAVPAAVMWFAIQLLIIGRPTGWTPKRISGIVLLLMALTGGLALPFADDPEVRSEAFALAGVMGNFLVNWEGLGLVGGLGMIGAAMSLGAMAMIGVVMMTNVRLSTLVQRSLEKARRPSASEEDEPVTDAKTIERQQTLFPTSEKVAKLKKTPTPVAKEEEEKEEAEATGMLAGLFRRKKRDAFLSEPDPSEHEEVLFEDDNHHGYDKDALAAARALEEARIDEEYERALIQEDDELEEEEFDSSEEILFHDNTAPLPVLEGNPANLGSGLAKLFPSRWEEEDGNTVRKDPKVAKREALEEEIRNKMEERTLRRAAERGYPQELPLDVADDEFPDLDGEDDPLFNDNLDTRPAGVVAAQRAAEVSAVERDETLLARRNRMMAGYRLPDVQLLEDPPKVDNRMSREEMLEISQTLERTFADFNIAVKVVEVKQGPVVTRFELKPAPGVKVSRIVGLEHDIAMAMKAVSVRIVAPIPGKAAVGIEIPNKNRAGVYVKELVSCGEFWEHPSPLAFALGKTIDGAPYFADLKKMPHLLIAGATGAGKSVCLNTIICSFLYRQRPDRLRLLMVDPKRVELSIYQNIPHLISPVVCDAKRAAAALHWAVEQMEERYKKLVDFGVRNIDGYNEIATNPEKQAKHRGKNLDIMPHMVVIVDELADLMVVAKNEVEESIQRLAQMSRAVGIHLILATQRPSVNVITGIIKANFPTRIAFQVSQKVDSRTILDSNGAETLLGRGDMLFAPAGAQKPIRVQGAFLSDEEVERIADHCRELAEPMYDVEEFEPLLSEKEQRELAKLMGAPEDMDDLNSQNFAARGTNKTMGKVTAGMFVPHDGGSANAADDEIDEALVRAAARVILEGRKGSTSLVQRRLKVGFARAGRLMDMLEEMQIVGPYKGSKPRDIMVDCDAALEQLDMLERKLNGGGNSRAAAAALDEGVEEYEEEEE